MPTYFQDWLKKFCYRDNILMIGNITNTGVQTDWLCENSINLSEHFVLNSRYTEAFDLIDETSNPKTVAIIAYSLSDNLIRYVNKI